MRLHPSLKPNQGMIQYNPVYTNQTKPKSSQKPRNRVTLLTRVIPSAAVLNVQQPDAFGAQKGKGPGTWQFPSTPIKSGCLSEPVSYRSGHKREREAQYRVGLHSAFTFATLRAFHLQSCSLPFRPRSAASHQTSHSRVLQCLWGSIFHLIFLCRGPHGFACSNVMAGSSLEEAIATGVRTTSSALLLFTPYFVAFSLH